MTASAARVRQPDEGAEEDDPDDPRHEKDETRKEAHALEQPAVGQQHRAAGDDEVADGPDRQGEAKRPVQKLRTPRTSRMMISSPGTPSSHSAIGTM